MTWKVRNHHLSFDRTLLMGVLNLTPDSFSDGGKFSDPPKAVTRALEMVQEGADILDLGAESTRPGAKSVSDSEELQRILPVLKELRKQIQIPISIDTTKSEVARICIEEGANIINDVSGLQESGKKMAEVVRDFGAGLILMHRRGNPETMQTLASYQDVVSEVLQELDGSLKRALESGIPSEQIVIDPGLGFAKETWDNIEILRGLSRFHLLGRPILLGPSRKTFIGKITGREIGEREYGTAAVVAYAVSKGVQILRVHEIKGMRDVIRVSETIRGDHHVRAL